MLPTCRPHLQVLRIIARVNVRGNARLAEEIFRAYIAVAGSTASSHNDSRLGSQRFNDSIGSSATVATSISAASEEGRNSDWVDVPSPHSADLFGGAPPPPLVEPLLRHASSSTHRSDSSSGDDTSLSGAGTVLALMQVILM